MTRQPLIIRYANLLHKYGLGKQTEAFVRQNSHDAAFVKRAQILDKLWRITHL